MVLPALNPRPGRVVEAEILRRFGTPINSHPASPFPEFLLVLSVGRCKFCLTPATVGVLLQSVLGGSAQAFHVVQLGDRVFRFSVSSKPVGFHILQLNSFQCAEFRVLFHLWHGGGPNYKLEYRKWEAEQAAEWVRWSKAVIRISKFITSNTRYVSQMPMPSPSPAIAVVQGPCPFQILNPIAFMGDSQFFPVLMLILN